MVRQLMPGSSEAQWGGLDTPAANALPGSVNTRTAAKIKDEMVLSWVSPAHSIRFRKDIDKVGIQYPGLGPEEP